MNEKHNKNILSLEDILEEDDLARAHTENNPRKNTAVVSALPAPLSAEADDAYNRTAERRHTSASFGVMSVSPSEVKRGEDREHLYPEAISDTRKTKMSDSAEDLFDYEPLIKAENTEARSFDSCNNTAMPLWDDEPSDTNTEEDTVGDGGYSDTFSPITKGGERTHAAAADSKEDEQKEENTDISDYTEDELRSLVKRLCRTDIDCIRERYERELSRLRLEYSEAKLRFEKDEDTSSLEDEIFERICATEHELRRAVKREKKYNKRAFSPILTDYKEADLHPSADRELLLELRAKLLSRLIERDGCNRELLALTSGKDKGREDSYAAEAEGRARAYKREKKVDRLIHKYKVSAKETKRLYALMDEYIECSARLAQVKHLLKDDPSRIMERNLKKERRKLRSVISKLDDRIDYYKVRAIERALGKKKAGIRKGALWIGIALLFGLVISLLANYESLMTLFT